MGDIFNDKYEQMQGSIKKTGSTSYRGYTADKGIAKINGKLYSAMTVYGLSEEQKEKIKSADENYFFYVAPDLRKED